MTPNLTLLVVVACLYATGVYLLLERSLTRVLLGVLLMGNGTNLLLLASGGRAGGPPILGSTARDRLSDPLAQAMILTAIVITLAITAFLLALIHRGFVLSRSDDALDDAADLALRLDDRPEEEDVLLPGEPDYDSGDDRPSAPSGGGP
jgi:multicomponent Na+:H+ antiporter subunit C